MSIRVMIVDDEKEILEITRRMLEKEGIKVITANSGKEALEILKKEKPDYIFLDIMMPEMDGWEVLRRIKEDPNLKDIPVAMLTVKPITESIEREEFDKYIVDYVTKPFSKRDLIETIKQVYPIKH